MPVYAERGSRPRGSEPGHALRAASLCRIAITANLATRRRKDGVVLALWAARAALEVTGSASVRDAGRYSEAVVGRRLVESSPAEPLRALDPCSCGWLRCRQAGTGRPVGSSPPRLTGADGRL